MPSRLLQLASVRQNEGPLLVGYVRQKTKARDDERLKVKVLLWNNPRVPYLVETMS